MRRSVRNILVLLVCWVSFSTPAFAATDLNPEEHHFLGIWGNMGYYGWLTNSDEAKLLNGMAPAFGFGYRFYHNYFLFQVGAEAQYTWTNYNMPISMLQARMYDTDVPHEEFELTALLYNRQDVYQTVSLNIPVFVGGEKERFYALVGAVVGVNMYGTATTNAVFTSFAAYDNYVGVFGNMPNHYLTTHAVESGKQTFRLGINIAAHLEAGARIDKFNRKTGFNVKKKLYRMYVGGFFNYGIKDIHEKTTTGDQMVIDFSQGAGATIQPAFLSNQMKGKTITPFIVGVKFTVLFELPQKGKSYIYDFKRVETDYIKRGGNQSIQ